MEEFNIARKTYLGSIYEMEEVKKKKLNADKHKAQEKLAAVMIQAL